jgi:hypothetical protein
LDDDFIATVKSELTNTGVVRITRFPLCATDYIEFLSAFGKPLGYYGDDAGTHPEHAAIWRIRYEPEAAANGKVHALAGPLAPHSSQSLRWPRPPYFSMLMVEPGWRDRPPGENGESLLVRWRDAIRLMRTDPLHADAVTALFSEVPFPDEVPRSVAYNLATATNPGDIGVRLKSDLLNHLRSVAPDHPATAAVERLAEAAAEVAKRVPLAAGDLLLLDNDRWGHGRESVVGYEVAPCGELHLNPRELWSATVG